MLVLLVDQKDEFAYIPCYSAIQFNNLSFVEAVLKRLVLLYPPAEGRAGNNSNSSGEAAARVDKLVRRGWKRE